MKSYLALFLLACSLIASAAGGGGGGGMAGGGGTRANDELNIAQQRIAEQQWSAAIEHLEKASRFDANNADIWNWLGYSQRKSGQLDAAFKSYEKALQLNPRHLGAREYLGEAYLLANNPAAARQQLQELETLCGVQCEQYQDLAKAIAGHQP